MTFLGPAFVAAVAYVDPGNFATNIQAGAKFGYALMWVVLAANLIAMLVQYLSAKLGVATGRSLPEVCRDRFPRWGSIGLWLQAEVIAMATDVAEFLGAAIGLNLLFGVPLFIAGLLTGVIAFGILGLQTAGLSPVRARDHSAARHRLPRLPLRDAQDRALGARLAHRPDSRISATATPPTWRSGSSARP